MNTRNARLIMKNGQHIALAYHLFSTDGKVRAGNLLCDTTAIDPGVFCDRLTLECEDGSSFDIVATSIGNRHITFVGTVLEGEQSGAGG
jgi:hypothetical protein